MRARKKEGAVWSRDGLNIDGDGRRDGQTGENEPRRRAQETTIVATAKGGRTEEPAGKEESTQSQSRARDSRERDGRRADQIQTWRWTTKGSN